MRKILCAFFVLSVALLCAAPGWSQSLTTTGTVQGDVTDEKGGSIPDATAEIRNLDTNMTRSEKTSADGHFSFLNLAPGRYTLTVTKQGFSIVEQQNINLTVGQQISLSISLKISAVSERVVVSEVPLVELTKTESSSTLNELSIAKTPVLGRKFEDLLTLTPGVSVVQGPDGDEVNFNGQRGIFNNISLDGGDYNNGFFGEQMGGQRGAIDITLDAVKEFQVIASGASAEFGRTAGGVVNVITKSGTNDVHGSAFYFQRLKALTSNTSDGKPLNSFHREQLGGTLGGPIKKDKMFVFGAFEHIRETLTRDNLSTTLGLTPCPVANPVFNSGNITDAQIAANPDCQRLTLLTFIQSTTGQNDGLPVEHPVRNSALLGRFDWNLSDKNQVFASYNFDYSKNTNQTFDVGTYGNSANGIEGPSKIQALNFNLFTTVSASKLNEIHFTYARELRPRSATPSSIPADTAMGFGPTFRFGSPFFLNPNVDETIWRTQIRDSFSVVHGKHTFKVGGEWLHTLNDQVFRGFFAGRYIFDSPVSFLHYASPAALGAGFGPTAAECASGAYTDISLVSGGLCPDDSAFTDGPLIFFLQDGVPTGLPNVPAPGASRIKNEDYALFAQDKWQVRPGLTLNYGLRWEAQIFPNTVVPPSQTAYGIFLSDPAFPSDGTEHSPKKELQPRVGLAWDVANRHKSVLRASWGTYYGRQNMLSQVGSITTNGAQQSTIYTQSSYGGGPVWPNPFPVVAGNSSCPGTPVNPFPCFTGVRVFSKDYQNPRIYTTNVGYEQDLGHNVAVYGDFTLSKGVHLTRFYDANNGSGPTVMPVNGDTVIYTGPGLFVGSACGPPLFACQLGSVFVTSSAGKSLYRGATFGIRKRFSQKWQMEANYTVSKDMDDDSNERDPFTDRTFNRFDMSKDYSLSDRDQRHRVNFYTYFELPKGFTGNIRMQGHSAQPITPETRVQNGVDLGRNTLRKDNAFFSMDWRLERPFHLGERMQLIPIFEMFNTFNNKNNVNPLTTPALFDFNGFLRVGVGDPRQAQFALRLTF